MYRLGIHKYGTYMYIHIKNVQIWELKISNPGFYMDNEISGISEITVTLIQWFPIYDP